MDVRAEDKFPEDALPTLNFPNTQPPLIQRGPKHGTREEGPRFLQILLSFSPAALQPLFSSLQIRFRFASDSLPIGFASDSLPIRFRSLGVRGAGLLGGRASLAERAHAVVLLARALLDACSW